MSRRSWFLFLVLVRRTARALARTFSRTRRTEVVLVDDAVAVAVACRGRVDGAEHKAEARHGGGWLTDGDRRAPAADEGDVAREERRRPRGEQPLGGCDRGAVRRAHD